MNDANLVSMIGNLSRSLLPVQTLITGIGYLLGLIFMFKALAKLRKIGDARMGSSSHEKMTGPITYFIAAGALIFLPSMITVLSNTMFGQGNILQYVSYNPHDINNSMAIVIQTAGLIWFLRGCVLMVHGSEPGAKGGRRGLLFLIAGILATNFQDTMGVVNTMVTKLLSLH